MFAKKFDLSKSGETQENLQDTSVPRLDNSRMTKGGRWFKGFRNRIRMRQTVCDFFHTAVAERNSKELRVLNQRLGVCFGGRDRLFLTRTGRNRRVELVKSRKLRWQLKGFEKESGTKPLLGLRQRSEWFTSWLLRDSKIYEVLGRNFPCSSNAGCLRCAGIHRALCCNLRRISLPSFDLFVRRD